MSEISAQFQRVNQDGESPGEGSLAPPNPRADGLLEPPGRTAANFVASVDLLSAERAPTQVVRCGMTTAEILNSAGETLRTEAVISEERPEDVVGVLPHVVIDGQLWVWALECIRPALTARAQVGLPALAGTESGRVLGELGGYLLADGVLGAAKRILDSKCALKPNGAFEFLGNVVTPNPGVSAELSIPVSVPVAAPVDQEVIIEGEKFEASRVATALPAQTIVDKFFSGRLGDPRLFEDAVELNSQLHEQGEVSTELISPRELAEQVRTRLEATEHIAAGNLPVLDTAHAVHEFSHRPPERPDIPASAKLGDFGAVPEGSLYEPYRVAVQNMNISGKAEGDPFPADAIVRQHDMLTVVVLAEVGEMLLMPVNIGVRPSLVCRDLATHAVHTVTKERNLEGISGSLIGPFEDVEAVNSQVRDLVRRMTGHEVAGEPILTPIQGYWSPGYNTTGFRVAVAVIQLDEHSAERLPVDTALAKPEALLDANVRDLPLRMAARIASMLAPQKTERQRLLSPQERREFGAMMIADNPLDQFIREHSPLLIEMKKRHPVLANLLTKRTNDGGLEIERPRAGDPDKFFFNSLMQSFMVHPDDHPLRVLQLLWHDMWHYEHPDPTPYERMPDGHIRLGSFQEYLAAVMHNEIDAVMFSDVVLPEIVGVEQFDREMGQRSLASLLLNAGIIDHDAQRSAVALALEHGELAEPIVRYLHESGTFKEYEAVIREKLLGYYVRDTLKNVRILYDSWADNERAAMRALEMGVRPLDHPSDQPELFSERLSRLITEADGRAVHTGTNPLQQALGYIRTYSIYKPAMRLEGLASKLDPVEHSEIIERIERIGGALTAAFNDLKRASQAIQGIEEAPSSVHAFRLHRAVSSGLVQETKTLLDELESDTGPLDAELRRYLKENQHGPFPILSFDPRNEEQAQVQVSALIQKAFEFGGYPSPLAA